ncbi:MAG: ATPase [Bacteroidales bacterium]|jgi:N-acetylglucosamine kinase-like BadF-type ATPase|nr:ATPase [Bacteroidales bacterium]
MILIADSGSTRTDWCLLNADFSVNKYFETSGLNANYLSEEQIHEILFNELPTNLPYPTLETVEHVYFYGSGCSTQSKQEKIKLQIHRITPNADIIADHDLLGAAISLCGKDTGVACILGTGSNSCFYDGKNVKKTLLSLGYLLGDEGSATHIGKNILYRYLKNKMPDNVSQLFYAKYKRQPEDMIADMYAAPKTEAYFGMFSYFASENLHIPYIQDIIKGCFRDFLQEQVTIYEEAKYFPIGFVGSVAIVFQQELKFVIEEFGYKLGKIIQNPINGLVEFYQKTK